MSDKDKKLDFNLENIQSLLPGIGQEIGSGGVMGYASGFATRFILRFAILGFGLGFLGLNLLQNQGYINVEWRNLEKDITKNMDLNNDGKIDQQDAKIAYDRYLKTLTYRLPSASGFGIFFLLGLKGKFLR